jgi:hypothetical protein
MSAGAANGFFLFIGIVAVAYLYVDLTRKR